MAYTTINKSTDYMNTKLYSGTGAIQTVSGVGFEPSWIWTKSRTNAGNHQVTDQVRGLTKYIRPNATNAEDTKTNAITAVNSDGFVLGADSSNDINASGQNYASWNWKANGQGSSNTDGSINTTYTSVNTTSGFSIIQYTGNGSSGATIGHGLGVVPKVVIVKLTSGSGYDWGVYHASLGNTKNLRLNLTDAEATSTAFWNDTTPSSSLVTLGNNATVNGSGSTYIAYCFAEKQGYSKFGSYVGNGFANGTFVYTGFKPAFVMSKYASGGGTGSWHMYDNKRKGYNTENDYVQANTTSSENSDTDQVDLLSNGFKWRANGSETNTNGGTFIYMAFGQPIVGTNDIPANAR